MVKTSFFTAAALSFLGSAVLAEQPTDALSNSRLAAISVAYDRANSEPETKVDVLSPLRLAAMVKTYGTHDVGPDVDAFGHQQWEVMQGAYRLHDAERTEATGFIGN